MMTENHMLQQCPQLGREVRKARQLFVQHLQSDIDVSQKLPVRAVAETALVGQLRNLADIMQNRASDQQVQIDIAVVAGCKTAKLAHRKHMFDEVTQK